MTIRYAPASLRRTVATLAALLIGVSGSVALAPPSSASATAPAPAVQSAPATPLPSSAEGCTVDAATLTWGFKESFRSYISGTIANGQWTVADGATYTTPEFGWSGGEGAYDPNGGFVAFAGSIRFSGHGGILDTTLANPRIRFVDADTAVILLDVSGTTQDGATVDQEDVEFVEVALAGAVERTDSALTVAGASTALTAAGSAAFGTYEQGEAFDPVSFALPLDPACATFIEPTGTPTVTAEPATSGADLAWLWLLIPAVLLLIVAGVVVVVLRRRSTAPGASDR